MEAIILAGGLGTRLRNIVYNVPKPMADISGRPFLSILLSMLKNHGFERVVLSVGYMADKIINYFGREFEGLSLVYEVENFPVGTGGAIKRAMSHVKGDHTYVFNGDTYFDIDIAELEKSWQGEKKTILVARQVNDTSRYGRLIIEGGYLSALNEKNTSGPGLINGGTYLLGTDLFNKFDSPEVFSFEKDFLSRLLWNEKVKVIISKGTFIDIGVPEDYIRAHTLLVSPRI